MTPAPDPPSGDDTPGGPSADPKKGLISGNTFESREVEYEDRDGLAMFEGDIILATEEMMKARRRAKKVPDFVGLGVAISGSRYRWNDRTVPYEIDPNLPDPKRVTQAITHWQ